MRGAGRIALAAVLAALCAVASAHSIFDFDDWMQRIEESSQDLQRHIDARRPEAAVERAREIEALYGLMEEFFEKRGEADDAVRMSREGREFAVRVQGDLARQRFGAAKGNALKIAHGCRGCHIQYKPL